MEMEFNVEVTQANLDSIINFAGEVEHYFSCDYAVYNREGTQYAENQKPNIEEVHSIVGQIVEINSDGFVYTENFFTIYLKTGGR